MQKQANPPVTANPQAAPVETATPGKTYRLIVSSVQEGVSIIQQKLGPRATVQSVKQYKPKGMSKLWNSAKLEIIVSVPDDQQAPETFKLEAPEEPAEQPNATPQLPAAESTEDAMPDMQDTLQSKEDTSATPQTYSTAKPSASLSPYSTIDIQQLLINSGFDNNLITRLNQLPQWESIQKKSLQSGLTEILSILKDEFLATQNKPVSAFTAFIGTPGVGKSTVLRKHVANQVFVQRKKVQILKLDDEDPNPDNLLSVFCDIIGVPLVRDPNDLNLGTDTHLYIDLPGLQRSEKKRIFYFKRLLDDLDIDSRVLVLNSMYDESSLTQAFELGSVLKATHQCFTHLDELQNWGKLWKFVLRGSLPMLFTGLGDETASYPREEFLPLLTSKTFPNILLN